MILDNIFIFKRFKKLIFDIHYNEILESDYENGFDKF